MLIDFIQEFKIHYPIMSMFGWGVGDIATVSKLAIKVYTAYKDAPENYRHISEEVESLQILITKTVRHIKSTTLNGDYEQEGRKMLKGCQSTLKDLNALIQKYKSLTSSNKKMVFQKVKLGTEDVATLRSRLISNTVLLNGFIQRFNIPTTINEYIMLIYFSCESHQMLEMQARMANVLGLHHTNSITGDTKAYKKFCEGLYQIGVTAEMISMNEKEIHNVFKRQNTSSSIQSDDSTIKDQSKFLARSGTEIDLNISAENKRSKFGWARPPVDFLVGPLMLTASKEGNTKRLVSTLEYIRNINFEDDQKETALHKAADKGHTGIVELLLGKGASIEAINGDGNTPLHLAAEHGHTGVVELLLGKGASVEPMNSFDYTPLQLAAEHGHISVVEVLRKNGAKDGKRRTNFFSIWKKKTLVAKSPTGEEPASKKSSFAKDKPSPKE